MINFILGIFIGGIVMFITMILCILSSNISKNTDNKK